MSVIFQQQGRPAYLNKLRLSVNVQKCTYVVVFCSLEFCSDKNFVLKPTKADRPEAVTFGII